PHLAHLRQLLAEDVARAVQQHLPEAAVRDDEDADHGRPGYRLAASSASRNIPATLNPVCCVISWKQVGLVTLISVSQSPITSSPTRSSPCAASFGPSAPAISRSRFDSGFATPVPPAARLPRVSPALGMRARQCGTGLPAISRMRLSPSRISGM